MNAHKIDLFDPTKAISRNLGPFFFGHLSIKVVKCIAHIPTHDDQVPRELVFLLQRVEHEREEVLRVRRVVWELDGRALEGGLYHGDGVHEERQAALDLFVAEESISGAPTE